MYYEEEEPPPPSDFLRMGSIDTYDTGFSIETFDKSLTPFERSRYDEEMIDDEEMMDDEETFDDQDDILEYHYPLVEETVEEIDDSSLAARDSLALQPGNESERGGIPQEILRHPATEDKYRRSRRGLWLLLCLLVVALAIALSIAIPHSRRSSDDEGDNNKEAFLEDLDEEMSPAPTGTPTAAPTHPHETSLVFKTLEPKVEDADLLLDPSTPQGEAFLAILAEDLDDPFRITQRYALLALYYGTGGEEWILDAGWADQKPNECLGAWLGVNGCRMQPDGNLAVGAIELESNGLKGSLPAEVCLLEKLENIVVAGNELSGALPACLASMEKLKEINIVGNNFSGSLPEGLLSMPAIELLVFSNNQLSGSLDVLFETREASEFLSAFTTLKTLALDNNMFNGEIPSEFFFARSLVSLTLHGNMMTGSLDIVCEDEEETAGLPGTSIHTLTADCLNDVACTCCTACY